MEVKIKWLAVLIAKLRPTHSSTGADATHVGHVGGSVQIVNKHIHNYFGNAARPKRERRGRATTIEHKEVLAVMGRFSDPVRSRVLKFMRREFDTSMVIDLDATELARLKAYVIKVRDDQR